MSATRLRRAWSGERDDRAGAADRRRRGLRHPDREPSARAARSRPRGRRERRSTSEGARRRARILPRVNGAAAISAGREELSGDAGPRLVLADRAAAEDRGDREGHRRGRGHEETAAEQEVEPPALDGEADAGEHGDDRGRDRDGRVEHQAELRQLVGVAKRRIGHEEGERSPEQAEQQDFAPEPGLIGIFVSPHVL